MKIPTTRSGTIPVKWIESRQRWQLTIYREGKKTRKFFKDKTKALETWSAHKKREEVLGLGIEYRPSDHQELIEARRLIPGVDLRDAARFYLDHCMKGVKGVSIDDAVMDFMDHQSERGLSDSHLSALENHCEAFAIAATGKLTSQIEGNEVLSWLRSIKAEPRTVWNYHGSLNTFFQWCVRRKLVVKSPMDDIYKDDLPTIPKRPKPVLSVDQASAMMECLKSDYPEIVPWHALQLFAGLRRAEVLRMDWQWIDLEKRTITLPGWQESQDKSLQRIVKTGDDWVLHDLPANLWKWLSEFKSEGRIARPGQPEKLHGEVFPALSSPIDPWPQNGMRHTFCTMMLSLHGDAAKVANWSRHDSPRQLYKSYVAKLVSKSEAERYFSI